jgi:hypothetical protein
MSWIDRHIVIPVRANTVPFEREEGELAPRIPPVHPFHPMLTADTIRVSSLREMWAAARIGIEIPEQNEAYNGVVYAITNWLTDKPELNIRAEPTNGGVLRIAATTTVPEEVILVEGALDVVKGLVWRRVDALEAILWFIIVGNASVTIYPPNSVRSFRELFALARTTLARMDPHYSTTVLMTPRAYGAALLENVAGGNDTSVSEAHLGSGALKLVPVALESLPSGLEPVVAYPSWVGYDIKRYIHEKELVERTVDEATDKNVMRVTCERFMAPVLPYIFYSSYDGAFVMPSVVLYANDAINEIGATYGPGVLQNLNYAASVH